MGTPCLQMRCKVAHRNMVTDSQVVGGHVTSWLTKKKSFSLLKAQMFALLNLSWKLSIDLV